ncbi:hypothetical protein GS507_05255 [Rhodococcus hoagii]|nr:hypothetical protein [Prescottella equi]
MTDHLDRGRISLLVDRLDQIADWVHDELENAITCQVAFTDKTLARVTSDGETPLAFNERASDCAHELLGSLREWTNYVATEKDLPWPGDGRAPHYAHWLSRHIYDLAGTDLAAEAFTEIIDSYNHATTVVDRPTPKPPPQIDQSDWDEARRLNLNARSCAHMAHTMGADYADLNQRRVKYLADAGIIAPLQVAQGGKRFERIFLLGDVLDAHLRHPKAVDQQRPIDVLS